MPDLAIIIVSWNVRDLLRQCLHAVDSSLAGSGIGYEVIVVDNASSDETPAMIRAEFPAVCLLESGRNLGFTAANNVALRELGFDQKAEGRRQKAVYELVPPAFCLLLNPDTAPQGDALPQLVHYLEAHPELVAVGPQLRYGDGSVQSSRRRFPQRATFFWESTPLERLWPNNPWAHRYHCADVHDSIEQRVDWLMGAALLVRGDAIARVGLLDERFFMYSEELEWQLRLQVGQTLRDRPTLRGRPRMFSRIAYLPSAVVTHHEGRSSEQVLVGRHLYFQRSKLRLAQMLYGRTFAQLLRLFLLACYCWELAVEGAKWLLGHRRALRRERIGVYARVVRGLTVAR